MRSVRIGWGGVVGRRRRLGGEGFGGYGSEGVYLSYVL
jgi:hypothetical protein